MAPQPVDRDSNGALTRIDDQMKDVVQNLYNLIVQTYDHRGTNTELAMREEIKHLVQNLLAISRTAPTLSAQVPPELIQYVQSTRNPDVYTRQFVELVMELNQKLKGKSEAFGQFRDVLARQMIEKMEDVEDDVHRVIDESGGSS